MKTFSNKFRESLRGIRELNAIVSYYSGEDYYILTTEDDIGLTTEDGLNLIVTESGTVEYDKETINSVNPLFNASLFKTTCKSVQIDCKNTIPVGTKINVKIGVYIPEEDKYEYMDCGDYYIIDEPVYQADKKSYLITAFDKMYESMIEYDKSNTGLLFPTTHKELVIQICRKLGWGYSLDNYPNYDLIIEEDLYTGQGFTYRDILDDLNGSCGGSFMINANNDLIRKVPTETGVIVEDYDLKDTNVDFGEKYGPVNSLLITTNNVFINGKNDSESIEEYGETQLKINDNYILNKYSDDALDNLFNEINGLEYNIYDVNSTGLLIFEPLDIFTFRHNGVDYKTIMFNDDIQLNRGLVETTYVEKPEEKDEEYKVVDKDEKKLNNAIISVNKANAEIVLKVNSDGKIAQVRLDGDADDGSEFNVEADNINFNGKNFNLASENISITSPNFSVSDKGNITATGGTIGGYTINEYELSSRVYAKYDYSQQDLEKLRLYLQGQTTLTPEEMIKYDADENGVVNFVDLTKMAKIINAGITTTNYGLFKLSSKNLQELITFTDGNNNIVFRLSNDGIISNFINVNNISSKDDDHVNINDKINSQPTADNTTSASPNMYVTSNGYFARSTSSSKRYKTDIKEVENEELDVNKLLDIPVRQFKYKEDYISKEDKRYNKDIIGFIVEEIEKVYPLAIDYNEDGTPEMWNSQIMIPAMLGLIQNLSNKINKLEDKIKEMGSDKK